MTVEFIKKGGFSINISVTTFNKWIRIFNNNRSRTEIDGFWVFNCEENIFNHNKAFVGLMKEIIVKENLIGARIEASYYDTVIIFTTADRKEIHKVKKIICDKLRCEDKDMNWVSSFESKEHRSVNGWLYHVNNFFDAFDNSMKKRKVGLRNSEMENLQLLKIKTYQYVLGEKLLSRNSLVVKPVFSGMDYTIDPKLVFILMPFGEKWSDDTYFLLKEVCESLSLHAMRADDFMMPNNIIDDIWKGINRAGIIIADITVHNANVFYELGIAHTIGKDVILIRGEGGLKSPFDISPWRYIDYNLNPIGAKKFKENLTQILIQYKNESNT